MRYGTPSESLELDGLKADIYFDSTRDSSVLEIFLGHEWIWMKYDKWNHRIADISLLLEDGRLNRFLRRQKRIFKETGIYMPFAPVIEMLSEDNLVN